MGTASPTYTYEEILKLPALITTEQAARVLGCTRRFVVKLCSSGEIKAVMVVSVWRVNTAELLVTAGLAETITSIEDRRALEEAESRLRIARREYLMTLDDRVLMLADD